MPFAYEGATVRTLVLDGEPWFVLADLCRVLDIANPRNVNARLADDQKGVRRMDTPGGAQLTAIVNESGMYEVVIRSDKPGAIEFRRWITAEVLPTIRRTGGAYIAPGSQAELDLTDPDTALDKLIEVAQVAKAERARRIALEAKVAVDAPKVTMAEDFLIADGGARLVRETAKLLGMREKALRRFLLDERLIFAKHAPCGAIQYDHYAQFAHHFKAVEHVVNHSWGTCTHYTLTILPRGIELIEKRRGQLPEVTR